LPFFIPEEAEKLTSQTPLWKIQLVKESLKYMMTDEDAGAPIPSDDEEEQPRNINVAKQFSSPKPTNFAIESEGSPSPMKASLPGPKQEPLSLVSLVNLKDRLSSAQVIEYLKKLVQVQAKVSDPLDDIEAIFNKIQKWKQKFGDLDQQEKAVTRAMKNTKSKI